MDKQFGLKELRNGLSVVFKNGLAYKGVFIGALTLNVIYSIVNPIDTYLLGRFIDSLSMKDAAALVIYGNSIPLYFVILATWLLSLIIEFSLNRSRGLAGMKLQELVRTSYISDFMHHIFRLPISFHKSTKMGEVHEKLYTAASALGAILGNDIVMIVPQFLSTLIFLTVLFILSHAAFIIALIGITVYITVTVYTIRPTVPLQRQSQKAYAKARGVAVDSMTNIRIVKDFVAENHQSEIIRSSYQDEAMPVWYKLIGYRRTQTFMQNIIIVLCRTAVLSISIYLVRNNLWSIGDLVIANGYLGQIFNPISTLSDNWRNIQNGIIALEDTEKIINIPDEKYSGQDINIKGAIRFDNVSFSYTQGQPVLENITFDVAPGHLIALVGESGVGKSTLSELLSAYYFPNSGSITVDGIPIEKISLTTLRNAIGVVSQEITLFNDTIRNNIRFGNFNMTDQQVEEAAKRAHCDFIERFPEKWNQVVGERGLKLSVGQKQRVAIARAILKNPQILILDEPTSALDAGSEKIITESLDELMKGKTTFVIAHRLSTVRRADKILVFKGGTITESGTHDELIKIEGGEYRRLYELQIGLAE